MLRIFLLQIILFCSVGFAVAQLSVHNTTDTWKGYERVHFTIAPHAAYYVKPARPLEGNPWVWRASFPESHTDMDSILLSKGMYIGYIDVRDEYGSPYAMQVWDKFYSYMTDSVFLAHKVFLEAVSRGAMEAYGWAKRNPDKVNGIYAEAPVCDIKSCPGGKGKALGDPALWKHVLQVYKMSEAEVLAFKDNPVDNLEGLASFKVPLLHIISLDDKIVPPDENSDIITKRYTALAGPVMIYPVTNGPKTLHNHHFPIDNPGRWADFIMSYSYPVKNPLPLERFFNMRGGLANSYTAIAKNKNATVAFLGGSITYGSGWRNKVCAYLQESFPETKFKFIAAGIPSLGSLPHAFRLQRDLLDSGKIDLLFVEAAVNDRGSDSITQVRALEGIVRHAKSANPATDIIMMSFADPEKTKDYHDGITPVEISNHELIAQHYGLPSINLAKEIHDKIKNGEFSWEYDFKDLHPAPFGHELYFASIKKLLQSSFRNFSATATRPALPKRLLSSSFDKGKYADIQLAKHGEGWKLINDWTPTDGLDTRDGFVHVPILEATEPGAVLSFPFEGNAVGIAIISGIDAGIINYSVDNGPYKKIDLYTQWSAMLHLPLYLELGSDLKNGKHILHIQTDKTVNEKSKGHTCRIVHFLVNGK